MSDVLLTGTAMAATAGQAGQIANALRTPVDVAKLSAQLGLGMAAEKAVSKVTDNPYAKAAAGFGGVVAGGWLANGLKTAVVTNLPKTNAYYEGAKAIQARFNKLAE
jgi:hypothetical protein